MPWNRTDVLEERFRFIEEWKSEADWTLAELCDYFGVTRKTGYKWLERYESGGMEGLRDQSRAPHRHPNALEEGVEKRVLGVREQHPFGGRGRFVRF